MFSRLAQLTRHFSRPLPNYAHNSVAAFASSANRIMTSSTTADDRNTRTIHTAACLIIGDEVLGGKASLLRRNATSAGQIDWLVFLQTVDVRMARDEWSTCINQLADQFRVHGQVLLQVGNGTIICALAAALADGLQGTEAYRGHCRWWRRNRWSC